MKTIMKKTNTINEYTSNKGIPADILSKGITKDKDIMENKYYQPKIEEFHVGFEYEIKGLVIKEGWIKTIFRPGTFQHEFDILCMGRPEIKKYSVPDTIRVKYLDKKDLEDLGWSYVPGNPVRNGNIRRFDLFLPFLSQTILTISFPL